MKAGNRGKASLALAKAKINLPTSTSQAYKLTRCTHLLNPYKSHPKVTTLVLSAVWTNMCIAMVFISLYQNTPMPDLFFNKGVENDINKPRCSIYCWPRQHRAEKD